MCGEQLFAVRGGEPTAKNVEQARITVLGETFGDLRRRRRPHFVGFAPDCVRTRGSGVNVQRAPEVTCTERHSPSSQSR